VNLARTALREAERICRASRTLEQFGKSTLSQSVAILDMENASLPPLLETAKNRSKDWKLRFWAVDLLGYVGNEETAPALLAIVRNSGERRTVRLKALSALMEISERTGGRDKIKSALLKTARRVEPKEIGNRIRETVLND
jgi:hypothetical protein